MEAWWWDLVLLSQVSDGVSHCTRVVVIAEQRRRDRIHYGCWIDDFGVAFEIAFVEISLRVTLKLQQTRSTQFVIRHTCQHVLQAAQKCTGSCYSLFVVLDRAECQWPPRWSSLS